MVSVAITLSSVYAMTKLLCSCWIFCRALVINRWKVADALHSPKGMRRHSNRPRSQANAVFLRPRFFSGICQKAHAKSMLVKIFAFPMLESLSSILGRGNASFTVTSLCRQKLQGKPMFACFLSYHDYATSPGRVGRLYQTQSY